VDRGRRRAVLAEALAQVLEVSPKLPRHVRDGLVGIHDVAFAEASFDCSCSFKNTKVAVFQVRLGRDRKRWGNRADGLRAATRDSFLVHHAGRFAVGVAGNAHEIRSKDGERFSY
jgi:hypothetical protein